LAAHEFIGFLLLSLCFVNAFYGLKCACVCFHFYQFHTSIYFCCSKYKPSSMTHSIILIKRVTRNRLKRVYIFTVPACIYMFDNIRITQFHFLVHYCLSKYVNLMIDFLLLLHYTCVTSAHTHFITTIGFQQETLTNVRFKLFLLLTIFAAVCLD
jgi:hypothetical protein